jgi:hypothetical protein
MHLIRLIYASKISSHFSQGDIDHILESSSRNNPRFHLSGILTFNDDYFLQCIEGSRVNVNQLYHKILTDNRHYDPAIVKYEEIDQRDFSEWMMGYIPIKKVSGDLVKRYSGEKGFNPYSMSGSACHKLLLELSTFLPTMQTQQEYANVG